jgi:hypothetical protein
VWQTNPSDSYSQRSKFSGAGTTASWAGSTNQGFSGQTNSHNSHNSQKLSHKSIEEEILDPQGDLFANSIKSRLEKLGDQSNNNQRIQILTGKIASLAKTQTGKSHVHWPNHFPSHHILSKLLFLIQSNLIL